MQPPKAYGATSLKVSLCGDARQDGIDSTDGLWGGPIRGRSRLLLHSWLWIGTGPIEEEQDNLRVGGTTDINSAMYLIGRLIPAGISSRHLESPFMACNP